jgi:hypothetical protein
MHFQQLLLQVRMKVLEAGCADRLDADEWLACWLTTPNPALGGAMPRDLVERGAGSAPKSADIVAELMGKPENLAISAPVKHW